jgi:hypothetical protein
MSLNNAINQISQKLTEPVKSSVLNAIRDCSLTECSGENFSFWRNKRPLELKRVLEKRLKMAGGQVAEDWLFKQLDLLGSAQLDKEPECAVYQGYVVDGVSRLEFIIIPSIGSFECHSILIN